MPTRDISLTGGHDDLVEGVVNEGEYCSASDASRDALRVLQELRREESFGLYVLRMQIATGVDALERGELVEVDDADLEAYLEQLASSAGKNAL